MKIFVVIFPLICATFSASISTSEPENTEIIPDVTSSLFVDDDTQTTEVERAKKAAAGSKTFCYETFVDGKSFLQCADEPETSETISIPSIAPAGQIPGFQRHATAFPGFEIPPLNIPGLNSITGGNKPAESQSTTTSGYQQNYYAPPTTKKPSSSAIMPSHITTTAQPIYSYSTQSSPQPIPSTISYTVPHESAYSAPPSPKESAVQYPQHVRYESSSYSQPQAPTYYQSISHRQSYPQEQSYTYRSEAQPKSSAIQSGYSQNPAFYTQTYMQPAAPNAHSTVRYAYAQSAYQPTLNYEGFRSRIETPEQTKMRLENARANYEKALTEYENLKSRAEYEHARATAEYQKYQAEIGRSRAAAEANAEEKISRAAHANAQAEYEKAQMEMMAKSRAEYEKSQAEQAARSRAEYEMALAAEAARAAAYSRAEYEKSRAESLAYQQAVPRHHAPAPAPAPAPVSYTYPSHAPPVSCPTNLLFSCVPNVAPVPCSGVSYEKPAASAVPIHHSPPPPPPAYTRPAPMKYNPQQPTYRMNPQVPDQVQVDENFAKNAAQSEAKQADDKKAQNENQAAGGSDWS